MDQRIKGSNDKKDHFIKISVHLCALFTNLGNIRALIL